jgi:hypothetical protein
MRFMPEFAVQLSLKAISAMEIKCSAMNVGRG